MPRTSTVKHLPPALLDEVNELLTSGRATLDEIVEHLRALGVQDVSRSALGRHKRRLDQVLERLRQSREMADAIVSRLGPDAVEGKQGRALVQLVTALAGDYMMRRLDDPDAEMEAGEIMALARAVKDASQASRYSQDFELKIREEARREAEKKLDDATTRAAAESAGLTPEQALERVRAIYRGEA